jgi:ubiquinol oxidase
MDHPNAIDAGLMETVVPSIVDHRESYSRQPRGMRDRLAHAFVRMVASTMDFFFQERYCHRAVVLETIAAVPGMVGGLLQHLKSLRLVRGDRGWIKALLDEAENERMHLMVYNAISKPSSAERLAIMVVQFFFYHLYFLLYLISPSTAHRMVGYFEEEAVHSYEHYLRLVEEGRHENIEAPEVAIEYWHLNADARLKDVIRATIKDEMKHRDVNHRFADDALGTRLWS